MRDPNSVPTNDNAGVSLPILDINGGGSAAAGYRQDLAGARLVGGRAEVARVSGHRSEDARVVGVPASGARGDGGVDVAALGVNCNGGATVNTSASGGGGAAAAAATAAAAVGRSSSSSSSPFLQHRTGRNGSWPPRPDSFSFHTVIKALAAAGMWEDALEMLEEMANERWVTLLVSFCRFCSVV